MGSASTKAQVFTLRRFGSNGGTSIYHSQDKITPFDGQLKITKNIGLAKSKPVLWLSQLDSQSRRPTSGLFPTSSPRWFYGDQRRKRDLLIFEFRENQEYLRIHLFKNFKPASPKIYTEKFIRQ